MSIFILSMLDEDKKDAYIYNQHIANEYQQIQLEEAATNIQKYQMEENLTEDIGGMGGEFARQAFWIGVTTGDIVVAAGVDAAIGGGFGAVAKTVGATTVGTTVKGTMHVANAMDNVGDAWRIADGLDDSFDTIKSFNRLDKE